MENLISAFNQVVTLLGNSITIFFWFVVLLVPLVVFHEFGHFTIARLTKTRVPEFGVGIPPRVFGKRWKGVLWSLNGLPLGGFVRIFGDGDAADGALDAMTQINQNLEKTDKKSAKNAKKEALEELKKQYIDDRLTELVQNQELDYFLETQGLELTSDWKDQLKKQEIDDSKLEQVKTLIGWEFENLPKNKEAFHNKPYWVKILIMLGGVTANFLLAFIVLTTLLTSFNISPVLMPDGPVSIAGVQVRFMSDESIKKLQVSQSSTDLVVAEVTTNSLAEQIGLKSLDKIVTLNGQTFKTTTEFTDTLKRLGGEEVTLKIQKYQQNTFEEKKVNLPVKEEGKGQLGVKVLQLYTYKAANVWDGMVIAADIVWQTSLSLFIFLGGIFKFLFGLGGNKEIVDVVGGPVAVGAQGSGVYRDFGLQGIMLVISMISINLGIFNLLPVPALDGGRVLILTIQKITKKRNRKLENNIITTTFIALLVIGVIIMVKDVINLK